MHGREYALDARSRGRSWWAKAKRPDCLPHYPAPARVCASRPCLNTCARHKAVRQQDNSPNAHRRGTARGRSEPTGSTERASPKTHHKRPRQHARTGIRPRRKVSGTILVEYSECSPPWHRPRAKRANRFDRASIPENPPQTSPSTCTDGNTPSTQGLGDDLGGVARGTDAGVSKTTRRMQTALPRPADGPRALDRGARERSDRVDEGRARDGGRLPASEASQTTQPPPSPRD